MVSQSSIGTLSRPREFLRKMMEACGKKGSDAPERLQVASNGAPAGKESLTSVD